MRRILPWAVWCLAAPAACAATFPLAFESHGAQFVAHSAGYSVTIAADAASLDWLRMEIEGADPHAHLEGLDRMPGHVTYLLGSPNGATYNLFGQVRCRSVYPGIDVVYHGNQDRLEYDFHLAPHSSLNAISLQFRGAHSVEIDSTGDLILRAGSRTIRQPKPQAWQVTAGVRRPVEVHYRKLSGDRIAFDAGAYDRALPLVIDPVLVFDTPFGGAGGSSAAGLVRDAQGNIYVAGSTSSPVFGVVNPVQPLPGTASMLSSTDGGQTWTFETPGTAVSISTVVAAPSSPSTLYANSEQGVFQSSDGGATWKLAGNHGLALPATDISVDAGSASTLYACGNAGIFVSIDAGNSWTASNTGIALYSNTTTAPCYGIRANPSKPGVVFDMAFNPSGFYRSADFGRTWTMLNPGQSEGVNTIAFNPGAPDSFYVGQLYAELLGTLDDGDTWFELASKSVENNHALVVDPTNPNNLYLSNQAGVQKSVDGGQTWTITLPDPSPSAYFNAVLAVDPHTPSRVCAFDTQGLFVSTDAGTTWSPAPTPYNVTPGSLFVAPADSRVLLGTQSAADAFITKWDPTGQQILYSTYLGGSASDGVTGIAVDSAGSAYVVGTTSSTNFPVTANALQKSLAGSHNAFVAKLSPDGSHLVYSTFFGGGNEFTSALAVDAAGAVYFTGNVTSGLPVSANAFQKTPADGNCFNVESTFYANYGATGDAFVAKIGPDGSSLVYASYLGGVCADKGFGIVANADGSAWVVGTTFSPDYPSTADAMQPKYGGGFGDGFIARVSPTGALAYSTYLGGADYDQINALTLDGGGNLYLTGSSHGFAQAASPGAFQPTVSGGCLVLGIGPPTFNIDGNAFVMTMNPAATAVTGLTYIGGVCSAAGSSIALDPTGAIWIAGTPSGVFPTVNPFQIQTSGGFVSKFSADLTRLLFSTFFDTVNGLAVDSAGMAYVAGATGTPSQAYLAKIDPTPGPISLNNVLSASPYFSSSFPPGIEQLAPGKVLRLAGKGLGPATQTQGVVNGGMISTSVAGVQVTFDNVPAPLLYVRADEIGCIAPFGIAGHSMTVIQVTYNGAKSNSMSVPVYASRPEVLAVLNQDFTPNSPSNPSAAGSNMTLYVTGAGQTNPASVDGQIYGYPLPLPTGNVTIANSGVQMPVTYAAAAYGLAAGILQVNFTAPAVSPQGVLALTVNNSTAYFTVTVK